MNMYSLFKYLIRTFGIYVIWITLHYIAAHLYVYFCVPDTVLGFIISPILVPTPHCTILRWIIHQCGISINVMWVLLTAWIVKLVMPV